MSPKPKVPATRIQKHGQGHSYRLDGEKVPGVTTILSNGIPKGGLIGWAANTVADVVVNGLGVARNAQGETRIVADELVKELLEWNATRGNYAIRVPSSPLPRLELAKILASIRYRDTDQAAGKGTAVHGLAEKLATGVDVEVPEELAGHAESYVRFLDEWDPTNALLERVVVNRRWRYMGKLDLIADFPGVWAPGTPWEGQPIGRGLLDVKTSRSGIFAETALQLAGYRYCETMIDGEDLIDGERVAREVEMPKVDWCGAIHVRADGYDVFRMDVTEATHRVFLYAKHVGDWLDFKEGPASTARSDALPAPVLL